MKNLGAIQIHRDSLNVDLDQPRRVINALDDMFVRTSLAMTHMILRGDETPDDVNIIAFALLQVGTATVKLYQDRFPDRWRTILSNYRTNFPHDWRLRESYLYPSLEANHSDQNVSSTAEDNH